MTLPFLQPVTVLVVAALGGRLSPGVADYLDMFCDDGVLETPYVPARASSAWRGKAVIADYLSSLSDTMVMQSMTLRSSRPTERGAVLEYSGDVYRSDHEVTFRQDYIAVIELRDGRIALFREYSDPLRVSEAAEGTA